MLLFSNFIKTAFEDNRLRPGNNSWLYNVFEICQHIQQNAESFSKNSGLRGRSFSRTL